MAAAPPSYREKLRTVIGECRRDVGNILNNQIGTGKNFYDKDNKTKVKYFARIDAVLELMCNNGYYFHLGLNRASSELAPNTGTDAEKNYIAGLVTEWQQYSRTYHQKFISKETKKIDHVSVINFGCRSLPANATAAEIALRKKTLQLVLCAAADDVTSQLNDSVFFLILAEYFVDYFLDDPNKTDDELFYEFTRYPVQSVLEEYNKDMHAGQNGKLQDVVQHARWAEFSEVGGLYGVGIGYSLGSSIANVSSAARLKMAQLADQKQDFVHHEQVSWADYAHHTGTRGADFYYHNDQNFDHAHFGGNNHTDWTAYYHQEYLGADQGVYHGYIYDHDLGNGEHEYVAYHRKDPRHGFADAGYYDVEVDEKAGTMNWVENDGKHVMHNFG